MNEKLHLGISVQDITPKIGSRLYGYISDFYSESINDRLTLKALLFCYSKTKAIIISASVCLLKTELSSELRKEISSQFDIEYNNIIICTTHTHTGPCLCDEEGWGSVDERYYLEIFRPAVMNAVEESAKNIQPVMVGIQTGECYAGVNRREITEDNRVNLGQNIEGAFNPQMTVISFSDNSSKTVANIIHYGCHATSAGVIPVISEDWPGVMMRALEEKSGAMTTFLNGPEGDIGPRLSNGLTAGGSIEYVNETGEIAARSAIEIFDRITEYKFLDMAVKSGSLKIPLKPRIPYCEAVKGMKEYEKCDFNVGLKIYDYFKKSAESYNNGYVDAQFKETEQTLIKIGNIIFASFPYELFCEIGMKINDATESANVLSLSNANGSDGYFVTQNQLSLGGYETDMFIYGDVQNFTNDADYYVIKETLKNMEDLLCTE